MYVYNKEERESMCVCQCVLLTNHPPQVCVLESVCVWVRERERKREREREKERERKHMWKRVCMCVCLTNHVCVVD